MRSSRREFLTGAAVGAIGVASPLGGGLAAAGASTASPIERARRVVVHRGRAIAVTPAGDRLVVAHAQRQSVAIVDHATGAKSFVDLTGQPLEVAIAPDGQSAALTLAFWSRHPKLAVLDLDAGRVTNLVAVGHAPFAPAYTDDGARLLVSGGEQDGTLSILDPSGPRVLSATPLGRVPRGLAAHGDRAWVALAGQDEIAEVAIGSGDVIRRFDAPEYPDRIAVAPAGDRLLVAHGGRPATHLSQLDLATGHFTDLGVGGEVSAVGWTSAGTRLAALGTDSALVAIDGLGRRSYSVAPGPRGLAIAGNTAFTTSVLTEDISEVSV